MPIFLFSILILTQAFAHAKASTQFDISYFKETYEECDKDFTQQYYRIKKNFPKSEVHEFQYSEGTIKSYFFPAKNKQENLLIMISGTHGIEAFAGSAVQRWLLDQKINTDKTAILMIHGFNLYGFKNFRRTNENNIDLNRNFVLARSIFQPNDEQYAKLNSFLNPDFPITLNIFSRFTFLANSVLNIAKYSLESLRVAILKGQYSYPKGIFYGGDKAQIQSILIADLIQTFMKPYKKIFLIDLHTGYGERSKLHLLAGKSTDKNSINLLKIFKNNEIDFADKKNFYAVEGDLLTYFADKIKLNVDAEVSGITFEYGTLDSQKISGSIESLRRIILENQNFHHPGSTDSSEQIKSLYREMFYPSDKDWRTAVLQQTSKEIKKVFDHFNEK